jgi:hypothetical protein
MAYSIHRYVVAQAEEPIASKGSPRETVWLMRKLRDFLAGAIYERAVRNPMKIARALKAALGFALMVEVAAVSPQAKSG